MPLRQTTTLTAVLTVAAALPFAAGCDPKAAQNRQTQALLDEALAELDEKSEMLLDKPDAAPDAVSVQVAGTLFSITPITPSYHARRVDAMLAVLPKFTQVAGSNDPLQKAIALQITGTLQGMASLEQARQAAVEFAALHSDLTPLINLSLDAETNFANAAAITTDFDQTLDTFATGLSTPTGLKAPGTVGVRADIEDAKSVAESIAQGLQTTQNDAAQQIAERDRQLVEATRLRTAGRTLPTRAKFQRFMEAETAKAASLRAEAQAAMLNQVAAIKQTQLDAANARVASLEAIGEGLQADRSSVETLARISQQSRTDALARARTTADRVAADFVESAAEFEVRVINPFVAASDQAAAATKAVADAADAAPNDIRTSVRLEHLRRLVDELDINANAAAALDAHAKAVTGLRRTAERVGSGTTAYTDALGKLGTAIALTQQRGTTAANDAGVLIAELNTSADPDSDEGAAVREMATATRQLRAMLDAAN